MIIKTRMIDLGSALGRLEEVKLDDNSRTLQLTICTPATDDQAANSIQLYDLQGIRNLQEGLFEVLLDFDSPENGDTIPKSPGDFEDIA